MRRLLPILLCAACVARPDHADEQPGVEGNDAIVVCGQRFATGTRVVLWDEPGGYDAYSEKARFPHELEAAGRKPPEGPRFGKRRRLAPDIAERVAADGWTLPDLQRTVDKFVLHYDVCGTSRQCFKVLHDLRKLSVHFLLDVDGTIYQTLDLKERAWHATKANDHSVGIEIAHIGAYGRPRHRVLHEWYRKDEVGTFVRFPKWMKETGVRTPHFVARPARQEVIAGNVQGRDLWQYDFTNEQYDALAKLTAALARALPRLRIDYPRGEGGKLVRRALSAAEFDDYSGLLGHYHVQTNKVDPGPAFDWERLLRDTRGLQRNGSVPQGGE